MTNFKEKLIGEHYIQNWDVRDQKNRNTCVAFAAAAAAEILLTPTNGRPPTPLSPRFLYYWMREIGLVNLRRPSETVRVPPGYYEKGTTRILQAKNVLENKGICTEELCKYSYDWPATNLKPPRPSESADKDATTRLFANGFYEYRPFGGKPLSDRTPDFEIVNRYREFIEGGNPVIVGFPIYDRKAGGTNLRYGRTDRDGVVRTPADTDFAHVFKTEPGEKAPEYDGGHVVCLVGTYPDENEPAGGWFVFRNSFGRHWATEPDDSKGIPRTGFGAISATSVAYDAWEFYVPKTQG